MPARSLLEIRPANADQMQLLMDWAHAEGWNPGLHDAHTYRLNDPEGFLIGWLDGIPVATISAVRYAGNFGFIGFYIVQPGWRGHGHGLSIWNAAMARLADCTIALDGVIAQQQNYQRSGFEHAFGNIRYQARGSAIRQQDPELVLLHSLPFAQIEDFERAFFPAPRTAFMRAWITQPDSCALGHLHQGRLGGFAVMRACRNGHKIGPLRADSPDIALSLLQALLGEAGPDVPVFLDVPGDNPIARVLAESLDMRAVFETARMYRGPASRLDSGRNYGITSFEIG